mmetsp:Transcript_4580/g.18357  ORF Transcript_4580/g.18357 Transcript_4580/m.18357 type:complete len:203 (-) Transcript_4580:398-1006(-)
MAPARHAATVRVSHWSPPAGSKTAAAAREPSGESLASAPAAARSASAASAAAASPAERNSNSALAPNASPGAAVRKYASSARGRWQTRRGATAPTAPSGRQRAGDDSARLCSGWKYMFLSVITRMPGSRTSGVNCTARLCSRIRSENDRSCDMSKVAASSTASATAATSASRCAGSSCAQASTSARSLPRSCAGCAYASATR